jgi:hypothetical protein
MMNTLHLQGVFAENVQIKVVDNDYFAIQYGNELPVKLTKEDAQELIGWLSEYVDGEV